MMVIINRMMVIESDVIENGSNRITAEVERQRGKQKVVR